MVKIVGDQLQGEAPVEALPVEPQAPKTSAIEARASKLAAARGGLRDVLKGSAPTETAAPVVEEKPAAPAVKLEPKVEKTDEPDPQTLKGIEAIEKRDQRARAALAAEKKAWQAEVEQQRAELARLRAEATKTPPIEDLKKLPVQRRALEALKLAGIDPDDEETMDLVARESYARSKSGKADPKNRAYADQLAKEQGVSSEVAELRKMLEETRAELAERDQKQKAEAFHTKYLDETIKAVPSEPSFVGRALAANPERTRATLLTIGQHLESQTGETPTHAEVIAAYETAAKQDLKDRGFTDEQIAAILAPPAAAPTKTAPAAAAPVQRAPTLDPARGSTTPPVNGLPTREQKLAKASEGLRKLRSQPA